MKYLLIFFMISVFFVAHGFSQTHNFRFFENSEFGKPFVSDIRSPIIKMELVKLNDLDGNYYLNDFSNRPFIETHLGADIPLIAYHNAENNFSWKLNADIASIVLVDMFETSTAPVINNDYFFGLSLSLLKNLDHKKLKNIGVQLVPIFHESTHLGDEFIMHGQALVPDFKRINISYEAWEFAFVLNDPNTIRLNLLSFKAGIHGLWFPSEGYYGIDSLEVGGVDVPLSSKHFEYFIQMNYQQTEGFLCSKRWMQEISVEARNRVKFAYDYESQEERLWSVNVYLGYRHLLKNQKSSLGFYVRYYYGVNPHGQMRNTADFQSIGYSIVYR
ncbi:MAG: DUF1207 domain-containing protein [Bacteroidales bacterium]|jgi:hypothetical protein|nr:DUF1207 domain-containing protein [Bacteroidales bacterium]